MPAFTQTELRIIDALAAGKSAKRLVDDLKLSEEKIQETVDDLKGRLGAVHQADIPERFIAVTGWANRPKDYSH
jgi:DNA-binding CsgD family transcriptional regulator